MKVPVKCRFPNGTSVSWTIVQLGKGVFIPARELADEIFGHIDGLYIAVDKKDWIIANEMWNYDTSTESNIQGER